MTTAVGEGAAAALQIGYNIKGYVSLWLDLSYHGTFGSTIDTAGNGTAAAMLGLHPLRFIGPDLPVDWKLYGGYGFFDILFYHETVFQPEATGKAWTGKALPFGTQFEYKFSDDSPFALGIDLRGVSANYEKWIYNNDKDISSTPSADKPVTTFRKEGRLTFGWHF